MEKKREEEERPERFLFEEIRIKHSFTNETVF